VNKLNSIQMTYLKHVVILIIGSLSGLVAAYFFNLINFDFSAEIEKARALGIVSITTLSGYPKLKDTVAYVSLLIFPPIFAITPWYLWARNKKPEIATFLTGNDEFAAEKNRKWTISVVAVVLFYTYACFDMSSFYAPGWNPYVGAWIFLGEDGENLAWVQTILSGGVYGKDFFCLYGPMLIYPLAAVMKIFGATVAVERFYKFFLDLIAYSIVIFFLYKTIRFKTVFVAFSVLYFLIFPPFVTLSVNFTHLRFILGLLPLVLLYMYLGNGKKYLLPLAGIILGQSLLFSQEAGIASCIALFAALFAHFSSRREWRLFFKNGLVVAGACLLSIAPMITFLSWKGAAAFFLDSLYGYPKLVTLGYGAIPAPSFKQFISDPFGRHFFYYWVIFLYAFSSIYLIPRIVVCKPSRQDLLRFSVLIFGAILYLVAVRRYSNESIDKIFHPALLLMMLLIDGVIVEIISGRNIARTGNSVLLAGLILVSLSLFVNAGMIRLKLNHSKTILMPEHKLFRVTITKKIDRAGIFFDSVTASSILLIQDFLEKNTKPGDYVYFFPNEAAYYFLFDRDNPTRYAISYFAVTKDQRKDLIADLEKNRPAYVVHSKSTWRVDNIREDVQVPEVVDYIDDNYRVHLNTEHILILKRKTSDVTPAPISVRN
jgi:hypothetical protein